MIRGKLFILGFLFLRKSSKLKFHYSIRVLYFSLHRYDFGTFWPNLRESDFDFIGEKEGLGYNINIPLNTV
jgi:histone deacetylase 6